MNVDLNSGRSVRSHSSFRAVLCAIAFLVCLAESPRLSAQAQKSPDREDSYAIRGTVVNSVTHAPVGRALVFSTDNRYAKMTDAQGQFEFRIPRTEANQASHRTFQEDSSFPNGSTLSTISTGIVFNARKAGYFESQGEQQVVEPADPGSAEIRIPLVPEALITGRVNLPSNEGSENIGVELFSRVVQAGRAHWNSAGFVQSRANGEFRFANLQAGEYKLFTHELMDRDQSLSNPSGPSTGYPPVYYPAASDFESAVTIHLKAAETFSANLTPSLRDYYLVKFGVINAGLAQGFGITIEPRGRRGPGYSLGYNRREDTIEGMLPSGNFSLEVQKFAENGASGALNFTVNSAPLEGPSVVLVPNSLIEVRVKDQRTRIENDNIPEVKNELNMMNVMLVPQDEFGSTNPLRLETSQTAESDSLFFKNVRPGRYFLRAGSTPSGYIATFNSGGRDLLREPLAVGWGAAVSPIELTIRDDGALVEGKIEYWPAQGGENSLHPPSRSVSAVVVLLPTADSSGQFCQAWVELTGEFKFPQVPPGEYRVIAFDHLPEDLEYENDDAMRKHQGKGEVYCGW